ncbi:MAG: ABC transporter permease, partial [Planctomycetota bacterium]|nr:ABC transporter permease [Planctomycetota bacterium]
RILPGMVEETVTMLVEAIFYLHRVFGEPIRAMLAEPREGTHTLPNEEVARISVTINRIMERLGDQLFPPVIELTFDTESEEESELDMGALFFPSMLFMTLFFLAQGLSEDVWVEKQKGTLRRALATPHRAGAFLAGKLLAAIVIIAFVSFSGFLVGRLAFGLEISNLPLAVAWAAVSGAMLTTLMLVLQLYATSQRAASLLSGLVMFPLLMIGGSFFPFEAMPAWMADIGRKTPNGWALTQLKTIIGDTVEPGPLGVSFLGIAGVSALLFLISTRRMAGAFATK